MTYRTAPRLPGPDLDDALRAADPLTAPGSDAVTQAHLASAGAVLTHRLTVAATADRDAPHPAGRRPRRWRRRLLGVAAAVVVLPTAAVVIGPSITARLGEQISGGPFFGTAVASDGQLSCEGGYDQAIPPDTAPVRLWPTALPAGWKVKDVYARWFSGTNWCTAPSLIAARTDRTGLITGTVELTGPVAGIDVGHLGIEINDRAKTAADWIGRYRAIRFTDYDATDHHTWVVTDASGAQWFAAVYGYPLGRARAVFAAATLGRTVTWNAHRAPGLTVVHRRTGAPYPTTVRDGLDWYVNLHGHGGARALEVRDRPGRPSATSRASIGTRVVTVHGTRMVVYVDRGKPTAVWADTSSGAIAYGDVDGDLPQVEAMLLSLRDLPADDPRLRTYALHEKY